MEDLSSVLRAISARSYSLAVIGCLSLGTGLYGWHVPDDQLFSLIDVNENAVALMAVGLCLAIPLWFEVARIALSKSARHRANERDLTPSERVRNAGSNAAD